MLRSTRRWHDAANGPLHGEARLAWFSRIPTNIGAVPPPRPPEGDEAGETIDRRGGDQTEAERRIAAEQEFHHRRAEQAIRAPAERSEKDIKASDVISRARGTQQELKGFARSMESLESMANEHGANPTDIEEIRAQKRFVDAQARRIDEQMFTLTSLGLEEWEKGDMTPGEFLARFETYVRDVREADVRNDAAGLSRHAQQILANGAHVIPRDASKKTKKELQELNDLINEGADDARLSRQIEALYAAMNGMLAETNRQIAGATGRRDARAFEIDDRFGTAGREQRRASRDRLVQGARVAVANARQRIPAAMPQGALANVQGADERTVWDLYTPTEKAQIRGAINAAAGIAAVLAYVNDDVESISSSLRETDTQGKILQRERSAIEEETRGIVVPGSKKEDDAGMNPLEAAGNAVGGGVASITAAIDKLNRMAGIEWMTPYEWYAAFNEVIESIKELRKRKSQGRITRAALMIGEAAALIPGLGGSDLVNVLQEQQSAKNDEVKDAYKKELGNSRQDYGFVELFGNNDNKQGVLQYYHQLGDTNRTRAILEFAAGKGLLYEIETASWDKFMLPGNIPFRELLPPEWTKAQVETWFNNLQFANTQGITAQMKAGEDFVSGRATVDSYLEPFKGTVNGLSLWFAKGIANKALTKVKEGEMSTLLTLTVLDAWENNALFRRYVPSEWLDRLAGDSKQLLIGMLKYDKNHLLAGARGQHATNKLEDADANAGDPTKAGKQRLGPLVVAARKYLIGKDKRLANDPDKLRVLTAKLLACKRLTEKDGLPRGVHASLFSPELRPYHIVYEPNEMRDANVSALGDDFFIERSEIINSTAEVMQYVGAVREQGFAEPTKARYFFSHIIDAYDELTRLAAGAHDPKERREFERAAENFKTKLRRNLDLWIERNLQAGHGSDKLLTEQHKDQDDRYLVLTLLQRGLISMSLIQRMDNNGVPAAKKLLKQYREWQVRPSSAYLGHGSDAGSPSLSTPA